MRLLLALLVALTGCPRKRAPDAEPPPPPPPPTGTITLSVVGTTDLHGHIDKLPVLAGYLANLRRARSDDGGVVLLDAGDMFQGTLESNLAEGAPVVAAYGALGYQAAVIGNHEFDFGPVGPAVVAKEPGQDPRGALRARAAEAGFPFLMANVVDATTHQRPDWKNVVDTTTFEVAGVVIGVVGVTTMSTPFTTMPANFVGLEMVELATAVSAGVDQLRREKHAQVIIVVAHAGGSCRDFDRPGELATCDADSEVFELARALPAGGVDAILAGHTHQAIAHRVNGIPIIQSYAYGSAFGRIDLTFDRGAGGVTGEVIFPPQNLCRDRKAARCEPFDYEERPVAANSAIAALIEPAVARAREQKEQPLGVMLTGEVRRSYKEESALGNLFTDLMRAARPKADVALTNGGGLRANLPAGPLTYGSLYQAFPFDNRFAMVELTAGQLAEMLAINLRRESGIFLVSGVRASARCDSDRLVVELARDDGAPLSPDQRLLLATNDFLASGGDGIFGKLGLPAGAIRPDSGLTIRDEMARVLSARGGKIDPGALFNKQAPRLRYPGSRPVRCR